jgi:branched-chain amino acid transport system substrate-binding protein
MPAIWGGVMTDHGSAWRSLPGISKRSIVLGALPALFVGKAARAADPIKIGFSASLTGGLASSGKANLLAQQIWQEGVNSEGGLLGRQVDLVYYDDQSIASTVPGIYAKLLDIDKVDLLMGAATNLIVAAMPEIMQRKRMVMVLVALGSNDAFHYPRYFQTAAWGPDAKGVMSNASLRSPKRSRRRRRWWPSSGRMRIFPIMR